MSTDHPCQPGDVGRREGIGFWSAEKSISNQSMPVCLVCRSVGSTATFEENRCRAVHAAMLRARMRLERWPNTREGCICSSGASEQRKTPSRWTRQPAHACCLLPMPVADCLDANLKVLFLIGFRFFWDGHATCNLEESNNRWDEGKDWRVWSPASTPATANKPGDMTRHLDMAFRDIDFLFRQVGLLSLP